MCGRDAADRAVSFDDPELNLVLTVWEATALAEEGEAKSEASPALGRANSVRGKEDAPGYCTGDNEACPIENWPDSLHEDASDAPAAGGTMIHSPRNDKARIPATPTALTNRTTSSGTHRNDDVIGSRRSPSTQSPSPIPPLPPSDATHGVASRVLRALDAIDPQSKLSGPANAWVVKPAGMSCGKGIVATSSPGGLLSACRGLGWKAVVQKYVERPLLVEVRHATSCILLRGEGLAMANAAILVNISHMPMKPGGLPNGYFSQENSTRRTKVGMYGGFFLQLMSPRPPPPIPSGVHSSHFYCFRSR